MFNDFSAVSWDLLSVEIKNPFRKALSWGMSWIFMPQLHLLNAQHVGFLSHDILLPSLLLVIFF